MESDQIKLFFIDHLIWIITIGTFLSFGLLIGPKFFSISNIRFIVYSSSTLGFIVLAEGLCLLSGNFDLSVGQLTGFTAMFTAMLVTEWVPGIPWYLGVLSILAFGGAMGAINGFFVGKLEINPFLFTLGTYMMFRGLTLVISTNPISRGFPAGYLEIGGGEHIILFLIGAVVLLHFLLNNTRLGSNIFAVGSKKETAEMLGISGGNVIFKVYVISGLLCGFAGLMYTGFVSSATPGLANNTLFMAFAGAVIGGIRLSGGRGSMVGALGGTLLLGVISAGLTFLHVPPTQVRVFYGAVIVIAILVNRMRTGIRDRILMPE